MPGLGVARLSHNMSGLTLMSLCKHQGSSASWWGWLVVRKALEAQQLKHFKATKTNNETAPKGFALLVCWTWSILMRREQTEKSAPFCMSLTGTKSKDSLSLSLQLVGRFFVDLEGKKSLIVDSFRASTSKGVLS